MQNEHFNKRLISESIKYPLIFFLIVLSIFYVYSFYYPIPTPNNDLILGNKETIGIGAEILSIGDRNFYFQESSSNYGYQQLGIKGSFLYPLLLNFLAFITSKLGFSTIVWNTFVIFLASLCAIVSLFFIDKSTNIIFEKKTANIASWIFVLNPYTIFYCISGGITIYMTLSVSFFVYLISKNKIFNSTEFGLKIPLTMVFLLLNILFISSLRPSGSVFSIVTIFCLGISIYTKLSKKHIKLSKIEKIIIYSTFAFCLAYCFYQIKTNISYISFTVNGFVSEKGTFFGIERELIRNKIESFANTDFKFLKSYFYLIIWKIVDFVGGLSDIRDSHAVWGITSLFPPMARVFVGIFIMFPINLTAFAGIFIYWKKIYYSGLWITLFASFLSLTPSLLGVAMSRYLIMVYPPIIIISAKTFGLIIDEFRNQNNLKEFSN